MSKALFLNTAHFQFFENIPRLLSDPMISLTEFSKFSKKLKFLLLEYVFTICYQAEYNVRGFSKAIFLVYERDLVVAREVHQGLFEVGFLYLPNDDLKRPLSLFFVSLSYCNTRCLHKSVR